MQDWLLLQSGVLIYVGLFMFLMAGAIGLPFPEDIGLLCGGILIQSGRAQLQATFLVCYCSVIIGDLIIFSAGRHFGSSISKKGWFQSRITPEQVSSFKSKLEKRSLLKILIARHLIYLRTATFLTCGAVKMSYQRFLLADAVAALISVPLMLFLGYLASQHYEAVIHWMATAKILSLMAAVIFIGCVILYLIKTGVLFPKKIGKR